MKTGVVIVNTARGAAMDEDALVRALDDGKVFSCGLDVYEHEPTVHPGLIAHPNVMLIPHMGTWTYEVCVCVCVCVCVYPASSSPASPFLLPFTRFIVSYRSRPFRVGH